VAERQRRVIVTISSGQLSWSIRERHSIAFSCSDYFRTGAMKEANALHSEPEILGS